MAIKIKRQASTTVSAAAPTSLSYGDVAMDNSGIIYTGDGSNKVVSKVKNASEAEQATKDGSGNTITSSYGAAIDVSENTIRLKSKSGAVLGTVTAPYANQSGNTGSMRIYNSDWNGVDGSFSAVYANANKDYLNLSAANGANTKWPQISVQRINGHVLNIGYDGNLWISW